MVSSRQKRPSKRLVLGVFPAAIGDPETARRGLASIGQEVWIARANEPNTRVPYSDLLLPGERFLAAWTDKERLLKTFQTLREAGCASTFLIRDEAAAASPKGIQAKSNASFRRRLLEKIRQDEQRFCDYCAQLEESLALNHSLTAASEWLLDNAYLVTAAAAEVRRHLPKQKSASDARMYEIARALVEESDAAVTSDGIAACLSAERGPAPLTMAEIWLFPLMLRVAFIERLEEIAAGASRFQRMREAAFLWGDRLAGAARAGAEPLASMLGRLENSGPASDAANSAYFALSLIEQLQDEETALGPVQRWIERRFRSPVSEFVQQQHTREAAQRVATINAFGSLRTLSQLDFTELFERVSPIEAELRTDPGGVYPRSDFDTRDQCRHVIEEIARHSGRAEMEIARCAVKLAWRSGGHVAEFLLSPKISELERETGTRAPVRTRLIRAVRRHATPIYLAGISGLTACFIAVSILLANAPGAHHRGFLALFAALALFPLSELAIQIVNALVVSLLPPAKLPKMDFRQRIPDEHSALVVVPMMLTNAEAIRMEAEKLEVRFLANGEANLWFGLLADFTDHAHRTNTDDSSLLDEARRQIASLNQRYPGDRFVLFCRNRVWSESEQRWIGRERKRGKLEDLNAFLCGSGSADLLMEGRLPRQIRYVLTLDADTQLPPGTGRRLVETIAHPLNRAELDPVTLVRRRGYSIIQPRVSIALPDANSTRFTRIFADTSGTDPYCKAVSDAHQDLFAEAIFHGKAIYDVRAFHASLKDRFPLETLLSHDLIEGVHAGVAHASDIELFETMPHGYGSFSKRGHRWIRGDWQITPWIFSRVPTRAGRSRNPLSFLNRWRILDNLRRSLAPAASVLLLVLGWLFSPTPAVWSLVVGLAVLIPALAPLFERLALTLVRTVESWQGAADQIMRAAVVLAFLPHQAWVSSDAIIRAIYRTRISRRNLLEWEPADSGGAQRHGSATFRQLLVIGGLSLLLTSALASRHALWPALPFALLWMAAPALMLWLDRPSSRFGDKDLEERDAIFLRTQARRTWRYFDDLVTRDNHWLPPDNSQLALRVETAQRTSPTNIGMWLTSALAAHDLGYLTTDDFIGRCSRTMDTLCALERYEGHFLNWYDTRTLDPLQPRYVSTVDSGNLLASLWVLEQGCREMMNAPAIGPACLQGLSDTLAILTEAAAGDAYAAPLAELGRLLHPSGRTDSAIRNLKLAAPPLEQILKTAAGKGEAYYWASRLKEELKSWTAAANRKSPAAEQSRLLEEIAATAHRLADGINMRFLYDPGRRLFAVGYGVGNPAGFSSHYDLLASECRVASLAAIAKGDIPRDHWSTLGRPRAGDGGPILLSWSGTMFEYLMPLLFTRSFQGSLLDRACRDAVRVQIGYGRRQKLPWGVSECAYSAIDANQIYQYHAFGVPDLALKRVESVPVIAPYATMLALQVDVPAAIANLRRLESLGLLGPMGFYESIDFSREEMQGLPGVPIFTYMAHHQGMSLTALDNVLHRGAMQRRFHGQLRIRAFESLLFERAPIHRARADELAPRHSGVPQTAAQEPADRIWKGAAPLPGLHLNGNGRFLLALTESGTGFSRWNGFDVTRWRSDPALDLYGSFVYLRDLESLTVWSATGKPAGADRGASVATFSADRASFVTEVAGIETILQITVAPEDDVEVRRLTVLNRSPREREIELTSYLELALAPHRADTAHPAFSKMFVETERASDGVLIAHRRRRAPDEPEIWAAHMIAGAPGAVYFETDRAKFLGRGNTPENPAALTRDLTGSSGAVLDPVFSLRCRVNLAAQQNAELSYFTLAASSREALLRLVEKYTHSGAAARAFEMAWTSSQLKLRFLGVRAPAVHRFQQLAGHLLYPKPSLRAAPQRLARNRLGQTALWAYGISGDLPILAITIADSRDLPQIREALLAHTYCRILGFRFDLAILNQEAASYDLPLRQQLARYIAAHADCENCSGGVFLRDWDAIPEAHRDLILASASVVLHAARGPLDQQITAPAANSAPEPLVPVRKPATTDAAPLEAANLSFSNGFGGFAPDEYVMTLRRNAQTPAPWVNVIANPAFGAMLTERGLGFTWNENSQTNRLTAWHNDPVSDPQSEIIYLRDEETGATWTIPSGEYRVRHGAGYSVYEQDCDGIGQCLSVFVAESDPVKICRLDLENTGDTPRSITVTYFAELVLGTVREDQQLHIQTEHDPPTGALLAFQNWSDASAGSIAFAAADPRAESWSGDRTFFFGSNGSRENPGALSLVSLDNRTGAGLDPCAALQVRLGLAPGARKTARFLLGETDTADRARELIQKSVRAERGTFWERLLGALQVRTPLASVDLLLNRWLLYQALSCRFWGRSAMYQSSGAYGFRDQLQDSLAFVYAAPDLTRGHILTCAARQFKEGDVQHWWHPGTGLGVRTRCSDDLVWLPYAIAHYVETTRDFSILDEPVPFLDAPALADSETDRMFIPEISGEHAPLIEHARRALLRAWRLGAHGLPLIGSGDWNDGLNRVGIEGRGESVWLAWFLCATLRAFANIDRERLWRDRAAALADAVERSSWDGEWYLRGFFDNGKPLGSHANAEARIDSLAQSWAAISGAADPARTRIAMDSAERLLVDENYRIVKLFTPPFDRSQPHPGYIMGYPPGIRENGGQYTHGSLWMAMARARMGDGDRAMELLQMMNPIEHSRDRGSAERYGGEPYAVAADVYSAPGLEGRAGWTWYTGSAAWMYRIWIEEVLGFKLRGSRLTIRPAMPKHWPGFEIAYRYGSSSYEIRVEARRDAPSGGEIDLIDDGRVHRVFVPAGTGQEKLEPADEIDSVPQK